MCSGIHSESPDVETITDFLFIYFFNVIQSSSVSGEIWDMMGHGTWWDMGTHPEQDTKLTHSYCRTA